MLSQLPGRANCWFAPIAGNPLAPPEQMGGEVQTGNVDHEPDGWQVTVKEPERRYNPGKQLYVTLSPAELLPINDALICVAFDTIGAMPQLLDPRI